MIILAIDTATEACSAALYLNGVMTSRYQLAPREHSRLILGMVDELLAEANIAVTDIDAIAFGRGPGSFMGLRIAAGVVQGIAFSHDIPVIPISTLKAIAQRAYEETESSQVLVAIDARMDEVYWAAYQLKNQNWTLLGEEQVISPDIVATSIAALIADSAAEMSEPVDCVAAGTGWGAYADRLMVSHQFKESSILANCLPHAEDIAKLAVEEFKAGHTLSASEAIPVYLRNNVAKKPKPVVL